MNDQELSHTQDQLREARKHIEMLSSELHWQTYRKDKHEVTTRWAKNWKKAAKRWRFNYKTLQRWYKQDYAKLSKMLGIRPDEYIPQCIERVVSESAHWQAQYHKHSLDNLTIAVVQDALSRILTKASDLDDPTIAQLARRALVTLQGER